MTGSRENLASTGGGISVFFLFVVQCGAMLFCDGASRLATAVIRAEIVKLNGFLLVNYQGGTNRGSYKWSVNQGDAVVTCFGVIALEVSKSYYCLA